MKKQSIFEILTKTVLSVFMMFSGISIVEASGKDNPPKDKKKDTETEEVYIVREAEELRDEYSTTYENSDGTYTSFLYASPIRYRNSSGELVEIDTSIRSLNNKEKTELRTDYAYTSESTEIDVFIPDRVNLDEPIIVSSGKYSVKLSPITEESARAVENATKTEEAGDNEILLRENNKDILESATRSKGKLVTEEVIDNYGETSAKNTRIKYDAFSEKKTRDGKTNLIELEYLPQNDGIKENIILNEKPDTNRFDFWLELEGLEAVETDYGAIVLVDKVTKEEKGLIPIPLIYELANEEEVDFESVHYELKERDAGYILSVIVDEEYLNDENRVYPLVIDPSITITNSTGVEECYVHSKQPTTSYFSAGVYIMRIGYSVEYYTARTYMRFPTLQAQIQGKHIVDAKLYSRVNYDCSTTYATLERITQSWTASGLTWNKRPTSVNDVNCGTIQMKLLSPLGHDSFEVTKTVQEWANGKYPNYGFCIRATSEDGPTKTYATFFGSRHGTADRRPHLKITYLTPSNNVDFTISGGAVNSQKNIVNLSFETPSGYQPQAGNQPKDEMKHYINLYQSGVSPNPLITYEITNEIVWDSNYNGTWSSANSNILKTYGGFLDKPSTILGLGINSYFITLKVTDTNSSGVIPALESAVFTLSPPDRTAPSKVDVTTVQPEITYVVGDQANNSVKVSFGGVSDDKSGMLKYEVVVKHSVNYQGGSEVSSFVNYDSSNNNYEVEVKNVDLEKQEIKH